MDRRFTQAANKLSALSEYSVSDSESAVSPAHDPSPHPAECVHPGQTLCLHLTNTLSHDELRNSVQDGSARPDKYINDVNPKMNAIKQVFEDKPFAREGCRADHRSATLTTAVSNPQAWTVYSPRAASALPPAEQCVSEWSQRCQKRTVHAYGVSGTGASNHLSPDIPRSKWT